MKKRNAFTIPEVLSVMFVMLIVSAIVFYLLFFIFKSMDRINFSIKTTAIYEKVSYNLENIFSNYYFSDDEKPVVKNNYISFPSKKISDDLNPQNSTIEVLFDSIKNQLSMKIDGSNSGWKLEDETLKDVNFSYDVKNRSIVASFVFSKGNFHINKTAKYTTQN